MGPKEKYKDYHTVIFIDSNGNTPKGMTSKIVKSLSSDKVPNFGAISQTIVTFDMLLFAKYRDPLRYNQEHVFRLLRSIAEYCLKSSIKKLLLPLDAFVQDGMSRDLLIMVLNKAFEGKDIEVVCW